MPASRPAPPGAARASVPAATPAAGTSHSRILWLLLAGLALAGAALWLRSSPWMREQALRGMELPAIEAAARRQPDDSRVQYYLAKRYYLDRRFPEARASYERAVRLEPRSGRA